MEHATILVDAAKLKILLAPCAGRDGKCRGHRAIVESSTKGHGGCAEMLLECTKCGDKVAWASGTPYTPPGADGRSVKFAEATLLQIGMILGGASEATYGEVCASTGIDGFTHRSIYGQFDRIFDAALKLQQESCDLAREVYEESEIFEKLQGYVGLYDGAWLHRGYASHHGSGAMVETSTGMVVYVKHLSKDLSNYEDLDKWLHSSSAMETESLQRILADAKRDGVTFLIIVGDADASTQKVVKDSGAKPGRCCNHGGKNLGKHAMVIGKLTNCSCPVKKKADGGTYKKATKDHRPITDGMAKKMQKAFGAATMEVGTDKKLWLERIKQIVNHCYGRHVVYELTPAGIEDPISVDGDSGDWHLLDVHGACHAHELMHFQNIPSDPVRIPRNIKLSCMRVTNPTHASFDCRHQYEELLKYMDAHLLCDVDEFITDVGGVRTNLVETLWKSSLKFRTKDSNMGGDQYKMCSNVAVASFNQPLLQQHRPEYCFQLRFAEFLGVPVPPQTEQAWRDANAIRMKQSVDRRTGAYRIKQATGKRKRREDKAEDKKQRDIEIKEAKKADRAIGTYVSGGDTSGSAARYGVTANNKTASKPKAPCMKCKVHIPTGKRRICDICRAPK